MLRNVQSKVSSSGSPRCCAGQGARWRRNLSEQKRRGGGATPPTTLRILVCGLECVGGVVLLIVGIVLVLCCGSSGGKQRESKVIRGTFLERGDVYGLVKFVQLLKNCCPQ